MLTSKIRGLMLVQQQKQRGRGARTPALLANPDITEVCMPVSSTPAAPAAPVPLVSVPFQGGALLAAAGSYPEEGDRPVPLAPFCERLGIDTWTQTRKLNKVAWTCTSKMLVQIPGDDQAREMVTLPLRALAGWLFTINPGKVAPEARPALVAYQREAADVLYRHFLAPPAPGPAWAQLAADLEQLRGEVRELRGRGDRRRTRKPAPLGMGSRLSPEDATRVRVYCETRPIVATANTMREALGLTTWTNVETSALATELRELGYERRKTYLAQQRYAWRWHRSRSSLLSLVSFRPDAPNHFTGRNA
jgi:hypothetical protein